MPASIGVCLGFECTRLQIYCEFSDPYGK